MPIRARARQVALVSAAPWRCSRPSPAASSSRSRPRRPIRAPSGDPAGPVLLLRRRTGRDDVSERRHRDRRPRLHEADRRADRLLPGHLHRFRRGVTGRHRLARALGGHARWLDRRPRPWPTGVLQDGVVSASAMVDPDTATEFLDQHFAEIGGGGGGATLVVTPTSRSPARSTGRCSPRTAGGAHLSIDGTSLRVAVTRSALCRRADRGRHRRGRARSLPGAQRLDPDRTRPNASPAPSWPSLWWVSPRAPGSAGARPGDPADDFLVRPRPASCGLGFRPGTRSSTCPTRSR